MAKILEILTYPDARLREISEPVTRFDDKLKAFAENLTETMYHARGIGLAAPQVGELKRMVVIDTRPRDEKGRRYKYEEMSELEQKVEQPLILINPVVESGEGKTTFDEGCLSVPGYYETVERFQKIVMKAQDLKGNVIRIETDGLLAICMQHELDHLDGKLFIDRLSFLKGKKIKDQIKKLGYPAKKEEADDESEETCDV